MPFLANEQDDEDEQGPEGTGGQATQGQILSSTAGGATAATGQSATGTQPKNTSSGSFTNLTSYLDANKGNDGAMGAGIRQNADGQASDARALGSTLTTDANTNIADGTLKDPAGLTPLFTSAVAPATAAATPPKANLTDVKADANTNAAAGAPKDIAKLTGPATGSVAAQPKADLTGIKAEDFNALYNGEYSGIDDVTGFTGYDGAQTGFGNVQKFADMATGAKSDTDTRGVLLNNVYGKGGQQYRPGENLLDSFILGAGDEGIAAMDGIGTAYGGMNTEFDGIKNALGTSIKDAQTASDATREGFRKGVNEQEAIQKLAVDAANLQATETNAANTAVLDAIAAGDSTVLAQLGLDKRTIDYLMSGVNSTFDPTALGVSGGTYTAGDYMSTADVNNITALQNLIIGATGAGDASLTPAMLTKSGSTSASLDLSGIQALIAKQEAIDIEAAQAAADEAAWKASPFYDPENGAYDAKGKTPGAALPPAAATVVKKGGTPGTGGNAIDAFKQALDAALGAALPPAAAEAAKKAVDEKAPAYAAKKAADDAAAAAKKAAADAANALTPKLNVKKPSKPKW